jgi:hypothetical protein
MPAFRPLLFILGLALAGVAAPRFEWVYRSPLPTGDELFGVCWGGGQFVAVGWGGAIISSTDGRDWVARASGTRATLRDVAWIGNGYLAVGDSGTLLTSADAAAWTRVGTGPRADFRSLAAHGGDIVLSGLAEDPADSNASKLTTFATRDLSEWKRNTFGPGLSGYGKIDTANGRFFLSGFAGGIYSSADGKEWKAANVLSGVEIEAIFWTGTRYVGVGWGVGAESSDGQDWTLSEDAPKSVVDVVWNGTFAAAVSHSRPWISTSADGLLWGSQGDENPIPWLNALATNGKRTVAVGEKGALYVTSDGSVWDPAKRGISGASMQASASGAGVIAVAGDSGALVTTKDGVVWSRPALPPMSDYLSHGFFRMAGTDTRLALLGDYGDSAWYLASADGVHWNERRTKEGPRPLDICRLGDRFLGWIPSSQAFAVSVDGLGWDLLPGRFGVPGSSMNMLWDGKRTLAWYGDSVAWTTDGSAWTRAATRGFRYASHMVWNGSIYASCARTDTLALSADGIDWEVSVLPWKGATANDLAWTGSGFAVAGYVPAPSPAFAPEGGVMYSPDGKTWEAYDRIIASPLTGIFWTGTRLVAIGYHGEILAGSTLGTGILPQPIGAATRARRSGLRSIGGRMAAPYTGEWFGLDGRALTAKRNP